MRRRPQIYCYEDLFVIKSIVVSADGWSEEYVRWMTNHLAAHRITIDRIQALTCIRRA